MTKKVLITGTSSGFGKLSVESLLKNGHQVAASMRDVEGRNQTVAKELRELGALVFELDVTSDKSVSQGVEKAVRELEGLDVLINNAGIGVSGLQEAFSVEEYRRLFEINVFGVQRLCRQVLPTLREQRSGLLLFVSSVLGRVVLPFSAPYNASKWALEAMAEAYRYELSSFGVDSCLVEPGGFATEFKNNLIRPEDKSRDKSYGDLAAAPQERRDNYEKALAKNPKQNSQAVADAVVRIVETPAGTRPLRTLVDYMGVGERLGALNEKHSQTTRDIYSAFGNEALLSVKSNA